MTQEFIQAASGGLLKAVQEVLEQLGIFKIGFRHEYQRGSAGVLQITLQRTPPTLHQDPPHHYLVDVIWQNCGNNPEAVVKHSWL